MARFGIDDINDYIQVQKAVNKTFRQNGFFNSSNGKSRTDVNDETGMVVETNRSGINETFSYENFYRNSKQLKLLKLFAVEKIPEVIKRGKVIADNVLNYHGNYDIKFAYIQGSVDVNEIPIELKLTIKKSREGNKFWVHTVEQKMTPTE